MCIKEQQQRSKLNPVFIETLFLSHICSLLKGGVRCHRQIGNKCRRLKKQGRGPWKMLSKGVQGCFQIDIITTRRKTPINFNKCFSKNKNLYAVQFKWNILYLVYSPHFFDISPTVRYFFFLGSQKRRLQAELLHWWFDLHSVVIAANLKVIKTIKQTLHPSFELNQTIWHFKHS